jgi:hypothetical protein
VTKDAYEWLIARLEDHYRNKIESIGGWYYGTKEVGKPITYEGTINVIIFTDDEGDLGLRIDILFYNESLDFAIKAYDGWAERVGRFRLKGALRGGQSIEQYLDRNVLDMDYAIEIDD